MTAISASLVGSAEANFVLSGVGIQLQQPPQFHNVRLDFRRNLFRVEGHEAYQLLAVLLLDLDPYRTRKLDLTCQGAHAVKVRIGRRNSLQGCLLISQTIDRCHRGEQDNVGRHSGLNAGEYRLGRKWSREAPNKLASC